MRRFYLVETEMNCRLHGYVPGADTEHLVWVVTMDQALQSLVFLSLFGARVCPRSRCQKP
jgi:hypothetical protein